MAYKQTCKVGATSQELWCSNWAM